MIILELISPHFFEQKSLLGKKITIIEEDRLSPAAPGVQFTAAAAAESLLGHRQNRKKEN